MKVFIEKYLSKFLDWIFGFVIIILTIALVIGVGKLVMEICTIFLDLENTYSHKNVILNVLTLLILIELIRSFFDYFQDHHIGIKMIINTAIVFVVREIMIYLYQKTAEPMLILSLSVLILVLAFIRFGFDLFKYKGITSDH